MKKSYEIDIIRHKTISTKLLNIVGEFVLIPTQ